MINDELRRASGYFFNIGQTLHHKYHASSLNLSEDSEVVLQQLGLTTDPICKMIIGRAQLVVGC